MSAAVMAGVLTPAPTPPPGPRRFIGPKPGSREAAQLLHAGIVVQPRRPGWATMAEQRRPVEKRALAGGLAEKRELAKPQRSAGARALSARAPHRHRRVQQRRALKTASARGANERAAQPFKYTGSWRYYDGSDRPPQLATPRHVHRGAVFGFTGVPDVVNSARLAGTTQRSDTDNQSNVMSASPQDKYAGHRATTAGSWIHKAGLEHEHEEQSRGRWATHTVRITAIDVRMASDVAVRDALSPLGGVFDTYVKVVTHDVFGREVDNLSWALVSFVNQASAERAMQRSERAIAGCLETLAWNFDRVDAQADATAERCGLEPEPEHAQELVPETRPAPRTSTMDWGDARLPIADALAQARHAYREGNVSRAVDLVDDFINEHPGLTSEQRSQVRSLYSALLAQQALSISSTRGDGTLCSASPTRDIQTVKSITGNFPSYRRHDVDRSQFSPRQSVVSLESDLFENSFGRPTLLPRKGGFTSRQGRRPLSLEQPKNQSKIAELYSEAQRHAQAAIHDGANKAAPYLRKAAAEAALGSHLNSMQTATDGLTVAPNDPKLIRRFQSGYPWVVRDRYYRNEIHRPRPVYEAAADAVRTEVVVEETVRNERTLQEMPDEWKRIDIMDLLLEQEKVMKSFDEVFATPAAELPSSKLEPVSMQTILKILRCVNEANPNDLGSGSRSLTPAEYKGFADRVEKALFTKGKKGGIRMLDPDDVHLLYSLRPADPQNDFDGIMNELNIARGHLKVVFKLYCMEGASATKGIEGMGKNQFGVFCDETELDENGKDDGGDAIPLATIDRIFIRANYDRSAGSAFQVDTRDASGAVPGNASVTTQDEDTSQMNLVEFVAACVRLAYHRYRDPSITERVHKFMQLLGQNPCFSAVGDEICRLMETSEELQRIFKAHEHGLKQAFAAAATLNSGKEKLEGGKATRYKKGKTSKRGAQVRAQKGSKSAASQSQKQDTIDLDEWIGFLGRYGLLNAKLTMREARTIFVQTNLDDELYVQEDGNDASQIVYDEFLECVVRCAVATYDYEFTHETDGASYEADRSLLKSNASVPESFDTPDARMCRSVFRARCRHVLEGGQLRYDAKSLFDWVNGADELITRDEFVFYLSKHIPAEFDGNILPDENLGAVFENISGGDGAVSIGDFEQFLANGNDFESQAQGAALAGTTSALPDSFKTSRVDKDASFATFIDAYIKHEFLAACSGAKPSSGKKK